MTPCPRPARGFSLTEMAVVLGVIGVIISGVWLAAGEVSDLSKIRLAKSQIVAAVAGARAYAAGMAGLPNLGSANLLPQLAAAGAVPPALLRPANTDCAAANGICADSPWGWMHDASNIDQYGTFQLCGWDQGGWACGSSGAATQLFGITLTGLKRGVCLQLATGFTGSDAPAGFVDIVLNGQSILQLHHGLPVSTADASAYCNGAANIVSFVYRIRSPT